MDDPDPLSDVPPQPLLRICLTAVDFVLTPPSALDDASSPFNSPGVQLRKVPVVRIFGMTGGGQKACMHVHGVWPYCFVPYTKDMDPEKVRSYIHRLGLSLNRALAISLNRNPYDPAASQFIKAIVLVKGVPFYGFHVGNRFFLKIHLVDPRNMARLVTILESGQIMDGALQPFESHIPFLLQLFCDYNLYGCGWVDVKDARFRVPLPEPDPYDTPPPSPTPHSTASASYTPCTFTTATVPPSLLHPQHTLISRDSRSALEFDVTAPWILNRLQISERPLHHAFIERLSPIGAEEKLVHALREIWEDEARRRVNRGEPPTIHLAESVAGGRAKEAPVWDNAARLWAVIEERIKVDRVKRNGISLNFDTYPRKKPFEDFVLTAFQAIEALYPPEERVTSRRRPGAPATPAAAATASNVPDEDAYENPYEAISSSQPGPEVEPALSQGADAFLQTQAFRDQLNAVRTRQRAWERIPAEDDEEALEAAGGLGAVEGALEEAVDEEGEGEIGLRGGALPEEDEKALDVFMASQRAKASQDGAEAWEADSEISGAPGSPRSPLKSPIKRPISAWMPSSAECAAGPSSSPLSQLVVPSAFRSPPSRHRRGHNAFAVPSPGTPSRRGSAFAHSPAHASPLRQRTSRVDINVEQERPEPPSPLPANRKRGPDGRPKLASPPPSSPVKKEPSPTEPEATAALQPTALELEPTVPDEGMDPSPTDPNLEPTLLDLPVPTEAEPPLVERQALSKDRSLGNLRERKRRKTARFADDEVEIIPSPPAAVWASDPGASQTQPQMNGSADSSAVSSGASETHSPIPSALTQPMPALPPAAATQSTTSASQPPHIPSQPLSTRAYTYHLAPPSTRDLVSTLFELGLPSKVYREPYFSDPVDVPERPREYAGRVFTLHGDGLDTLREWPSAATTPSEGTEKGKGKAVAKPKLGIRAWEYAPAPLSKRKALKWLKEHGRMERGQSARGKLAMASQFEGPTQARNFGYKAASQKKPKPKYASYEKQNMSLLAIEVFCNTRGHLVADPKEDKISALFYCFQNEDDELPDVGGREGYYCGMILVSTPQVEPRRIAMADRYPVEYVESELELLNTLIDRVREWDPDVLAGWDCQYGSWGYVQDRGRDYGDMSVSEEISRVRVATSRPAGSDRWNQTKTTTFLCAGRHVLNVWRIMRSELSLTHNSFEHVAQHVLKQRVPRYSPETLTSWYNSIVPAHTARVLQHFLTRVTIDVELLDNIELVTKTAEFARVFGIDFNSVLSRGSQFKVESFMFRIAKPESFILISPSRTKVGQQNAAEAIPLIMEPKSAFYKDPVVVLDFQSLYPSIMLAYNYCYSTTLGRVEAFKGSYKLGVADHRLDDGVLELLKDHIIVSPNGMMYVKPEIRKSLLSKMLGEILDTRVMVKQAMKGARNDPILYKLLNARQLGLKFIANVTYGYTSASFSGRMPGVEIADSIVQTGRETLEKAMNMIHANAEWGAEVVYGDTDSLFIHLPGRTKDEAFRIGNEIADAVTAANPRPVKLKFEKVYLPCVLMAKKRYVGAVYEHPDETEPSFQAKGIETVRRDGVPAQSKLLETCLKILFRTQDLSEVKDYCQRQWSKLQQGKVSIQDFIYAKEVKLGSYSETSVPLPGVMVAARMMNNDPRTEAHYGERIPYVLLEGEPGARQIDKAVPPEVALQDRRVRLDATHYITKVLIPPLERVFNLIGADVPSWFKSMPKTVKADTHRPFLPPEASEGLYGAPCLTINQYYRSNCCEVCGHSSSTVICSTCSASENLADTAYTLYSRLHLAEKRLLDSQLICASCSSVPACEPIRCDNIDCPVLYERTRAAWEAEDVRGVREVMKRLEAGQSLDW